MPDSRLRELLLERHPETPCSAVRAVAARVNRGPRLLELRYSIEGDIARLRLPPSAAPRVAEGLWRHTCCELFIACEGRPGYREYNFSPSGEWAAHAFARYREAAPMLDQPLNPGIAVRKQAQRLELSAGVALEHAGKVALGLAAVIEEQDGALSYWALRHPAGTPDFHHPEAFALALDEVRD
ncbi:MAG TPA: DOMON-like domain-containing protein [Burkholderiales bacterium]|jgi:hypothetical protein|nr:DOMON-like domain-containing protein [Burkholderiales bacterium]